MNVKMKVNGKNEYANGVNVTTTISLVPVNEPAEATQLSGNITINTTDQVLADSLNFRDELTISFDKVATN